jgi:hypothetical protein
MGIYVNRCEFVAGASFLFNVFIRPSREIRELNQRSQPLCSRILMRAVPFVVRKD